MVAESSLWSGRNYFRLVQPDRDGYLTAGATSPFSRHGASVQPSGGIGHDQRRPLVAGRRPPSAAYRLSGDFKSGGNVSSFGFLDVAGAK